MRGGISKNTRQRAALGLISFLLAVGSRPGLEAYARPRVHLLESVKNFDNQERPLIQTLVSIARTYRLPLGIELVTEEALQKPIQVRVKEATIKQLLDLCVNQVAGYSWAYRDGVIHIYGEDEFKDPANGFNRVLERFSVRDETLVSADIKLGFAVKGQKSESGKEKNSPGGFISSYLGDPDPDMRPLTLEMDNATVREILNRLVAQFDGTVIWISRVPPERLSDLPTAGLWRIIGPETDDPSGLLDVGRP